MIQLIEFKYRRFACFLINLCFATFWFLQTFCFDLLNFYKHLLHLCFIYVLCFLQMFSLVKFFVCSCKCLFVRIYVYATVNLKNKCISGEKCYKSVEYNFILFFLQTLALIYCIFVRFLEMFFVFTDGLFCLVTFLVCSYKCLFCYTCLF